MVGCRICKLENVSKFEFFNSLDIVYYIYMFTTFCFETSRDNIATDKELLID